MVFFSLLLGSLGALFVSAYGFTLGIIDQPNSRSSHSRPTPKGGGAGILVAFMLAAGWLGMPPLFWVPTVVLSGVSFLGDRVKLSPGLRLVVQIAAAAATLGTIVGAFPQALCSRGEWLFVGLPLAAFYVVATANIYNFMDGINGIAGITGAIAFGLLALTGGLLGEANAWVILAVALSAGCAGFLPWNFPRARVFMGDVGSVLLGFVFALYAVAWSRTLADFLLFASFLFPFYLDEAVTLVPRLREGNSLTRPHRRHVYQILVNQMGIPHWRISLLYGTVQLIVALGTLCLRFWGWQAEALWLAAMCGLGVGLATWVRRRER